MEIAYLARTNNKQQSLFRKIIPKYVKVTPQNFKLQPFNAIVRIVEKLKRHRCNNPTIFMFSSVAKFIYSDNENNLFRKNHF